MAAEFQERRRTPRVTMTVPQEFRLGQRIRVRIVDISAGGVLLACDEPLAVGSTGRLQVSLGGSQFEGQVQVRREQPAPDGKGHWVGSALTAAQPRYRDVLDQFLKRAGD